MITMKKKTKHADLVVRIPDNKYNDYYQDGWRVCPKKVWRRSNWAVKKDMSGLSTKVKVDPVRDRIEKRQGLRATHLHWKVPKIASKARKAIMGSAFDDLMKKLGLGALVKNA